MLPQQLVLPFIFLLSLIAPPNPVSGRPQISLSVVEDDAPVRSHPPTPEDLEERRQALVNSVAGFAAMSGGRSPSAITDLGLDLVGGAIRNAGTVFAPLTNATRTAAQGLPRLGTVINGLTDGARSYSRQVAGGLRSTADVVVNNAIKVVTTASMRGSEVLSGVFKLMRTLLDKFTRAITALAQNVSKGVQNATKLGSQFLARNAERARTALANPLFLQPAKDVLALGGNLVRGLTSDFTEAQSWVNDGVKSKLNLGNALIPHIQLSSILSPLTDPESSSNLNSEGYGNKRESEKEMESKPSEESNPANNISPSDILDLLDPTEDKLDESESKSVAVESNKAATTESKINEIEPTTTSTPTPAKSTESSTAGTTTTSTTTSEISTTASTSTTEVPTTTPSPDSSTTASKSDTTEASGGLSSPPADTVEELFGLATRLLSID